MSMSKADNLLWLAYADLIRRQLQVTNIGPNDVIFPYPVTQRGTAAGRAIPGSVTNFLVFNLADNLRPAESPDSKTAGSYSQELRQYLSWVEPSPPATPGALQRLEEANRVLRLAEEVLIQADDGAFGNYGRAKRRDPDIAPYYDWVVENAPRFMQQEQTVQNAAYRVRTARTDCYGPDASLINEYLTALETATSRTTRADTLNMSALTMDSDLRRLYEERGASGGEVTPQEKEAAEKASTRVPSYQINSLSSTMNDWIRQGSEPRRQWLQLDLSVGENMTWKDFGFTHERSSASVSWFPFFSASVVRNNKTTTEHLKIENDEINISIEVSFQQITALDIQRGLWDVANVKGRFPKLRDGAPPDILSDKVIVNKVLFAYDVALRVTFRGNLKQQAHDLLEEAKKSRKGLWIFGFHIGEGSDEYVKTGFDSVKWDEATGSILLEPARDVAYPTLLGILGQRL